jgi:hypothetical protein
MFDPDLQEIIRWENSKFIEQAQERSENYIESPKMIINSPKEKGIKEADLDELTASEVQKFIDKAKSGLQIGTEEYYRFFSCLGLNSNLLCI